MAITQDPSTPAAVQATVTSATLTLATAAFSPPAGCLLAAVVAIGHAAGTPAVALSSTISGNPAWTAGPALDAGNNFAGIWFLYLASAPGSITVTAANSTSQSQGGQLSLLVLDGAASVQGTAGNAGSATTSGTSATLTGTVTTTVPGSWPLLACASAERTVTPNGSTSTISNYQTSSSTLLSGQQTNATGTPGAATLGWTTGTSTAFTWAALEILPVTSTPVSLADAAGAADLDVSQPVPVPPAIITAAPVPAGPPSPPVPSQILTVPQGNAVPQDQAGAAEAMTAATVTVPLADAGGAADTVSAGLMPQDQAAAAEAMTAATAVPLADAGAAADQDIPAVQASLPDYAGAVDLGQATGLTQSDTAGAAGTLAAAVTVHLADTGAAADAAGQEPAIGASGGATIPHASPGTSQVAVAAPGSSNWVYLGSIGQVTALTYSFTCPGGADQMTCTVMVPASYRNQAFSPGWQVRVYRGGHQVWDGKMDEPVPTASGWNFTAAGNGMRGTDFLAVYTSTWPANQPDESINGAISRGLPWVNPGVGTPAGAWYGQAVDSGAQTITDLLNLICTRGGMTWYVNSQPGGLTGDGLSVFPLPSTPDRLLIATTPVPRTLGGDINTIFIRYEITADNTSSSSSSAAAATYGLVVVQNTVSVAMHQVIETYIDLSDAGVMTAGQAEAVGEYVLEIYQRASFAGPFTGNYGQLMNMGGTPVDPGTDQAGHVVRLILTDFSDGAELTPGPPEFIVGSYSWDDFAQTFTLSAYQTLNQSLTGLLSMESTLLTPVTVASG